MLIDKDFITSFYFGGHNYFYIYGHIWGTTVNIIIKFFINEKNSTKKTVEFLFISSCDI